MDQATLKRKAIAGFANLAVVMALCVFLPAGTIRYWEGWVFWAVFFGLSAAISVWVYRHDPALLERRLAAGPAAETDPVQKLIQALAGILFLALMIVPALDHRFGWSHVSLWTVIAGDALVAIGFWIVFEVFRVNSFTSATIEVGDRQPVISTGPYALVRHPMYAGALLLFAGIPLALGSRVGLWLVVPGIGILVWRLLAEERFLAANLAGYEDYRQKVRHRLIPGVW